MVLEIFDMLKGSRGIWLNFENDIKNFEYTRRYQRNLDEF